VKIFFGILEYPGIFGLENNLQPNPSSAESFKPPLSQRPPHPPQISPVFVVLNSTSARTLYPVGFNGSIVCEVLAGIGLVDAGFLLAAGRVGKEVS
jgi:hypothetical protein